MRRKARDGDGLVVDDRTGFTVWRSDCIREWNGALVHKRHFEARHPLDFIRPRREEINVPEARPRPVDTYVGPLRTEITAISAAGSREITVLHTERMLPGDRLGLMLDSGDLYRAVIQSVDSTTALTLTADLPGSIAVGSSVLDYTAISPANLE